MTKILFAFAAASALPLVTSALAQVPAQIDLESVEPVGGTWTYRAVAGGSEADFVDSSATVRLQIKCDRARRAVSLVRPSVPAAAPTLTIWTSELSRTVPARFLATNELIADLASTDPLLDSIAFSRGRFATAASGAPMVALPAAPEATRVVEDCRS